MKDRMTKNFPKVFLYFLGALFLINLAQSAFTQLIFDEAYYYHWSQDLSWGYYSKPPVVAWLIRFSTDLFGVNALAVKLMSPIAYCAASVIVYLIGEKLQGEKTGFFSALIFSTLENKKWHSYISIFTITFGAFYFINKLIR